MSTPSSDPTTKTPQKEAEPRLPTGLEFPEPAGRIDLLRRIPMLRGILASRWFQFLVILPNLVLFGLFITAGLIGTPVGNRNIIIVFVWILWWFLLIGLMVPFASRLWCTMCPFPFFGEWLQRRSLIRAREGKTVGRNKYFGLNLRWPKKLSNIWMQNVGFLALCTFSAIFLTRPAVSSWILGSLVVLATIFHLIFRHRAFCNYVCPVSGFLSLYAMASTTEVRSRSEEVCKKCKSKACLAGSKDGWGCPWSMYPSKMDRNNYCGLCMECISTCPHDNLTVNLRPFCSDTKIKGYDEAWKAFIMLTLVGVYSVLYQGPWGHLRNWANFSESGDYAGFGIYVATIWLTGMVVVPAIFMGSTVLGRRMASNKSVSFKETFLSFAYPLVPLGLLLWVAFSIPMVMVNWSYIANVISDPFGWGWDLFGTAHVPWQPVLPQYIAHIQIPLILVGLYYALKTGWQHAMRLFDGRVQALRAFLPTGLLLTAIAGVFVGLYAG